eukprot:1995637-Amphidinium_carterae.1
MAGLLKNRQSSFIRKLSPRLQPSQTCTSWSNMYFLATRALRHSHSASRAGYIKLRQATLANSTESRVRHSTDSATQIVQGEGALAQ